VKNSTLGEKETMERYACLTVVLLAIVSVQYAQAAEVSTGLTLQHGDWVRTAVFSPDGKKVATASIDGTACIWDAETGQKLHILEGHEINVYSAVFSPDGEKIVTAGNGTVRIWDVATGKELHVLDKREDWIKAEITAAFTPDGKKIVAQSYKIVQMWDSDSGKELVGLEKPAHRSAQHTLFVVFSPDSKKIITTSDDSIWSSDANGKLQEKKEHSVHIFDADSGKRIQTLKGHTDWVRIAAFTSDGKKFVTASDDGTARIWDTDSGDNLQTLKGLTGWVLCATLLPDNEKVFTAGDDGIIRIWDVESGEQLQSLNLRRPMWIGLFPEKSTLEGVALSPNGKIIAVAQSNRTVEIVDIESERVVQTFTGHTHHGFWSIAFSPDGKKVVTASADKTARIWTLE